MLVARGRASARAAITEVAAVRRAVTTVSSLISSGRPLLTSASTPKAITVGRPVRVFLGWPLTYLKLYMLSSAIGISSITPWGEWLATRALLSNALQRRKSASIRWAIWPSTTGMPCAATILAMSAVVRRMVMVGCLRVWWGCRHC